MSPVITDGTGFNLNSSPYIANAHGLLWSGTAQSYFVDQPTNALRHLAEYGIDANNHSELIPFLNRYPGITAYLYELPEALAPFRDNSAFYLELMHDDEAGEGETVFLTIHTNLDVTDARERLRVLEEQWLYPIDEPDMYTFSFALEYTDNV